MKAYWIGCMCGDDTEPEPLKHAATCPISREAQRATAVPKCDTCGRFARRLSAVAMSGSVTPDFRCPDCRPTTSTATRTTASTTTTPSPTSTAAASTSSATPTTEEPVPTTPTATETVPTDIGDLIDEVLGTETP